MESLTIDCPFIYSNGQCCSGKVSRARAYGPTRGGHYVERTDVSKYRLWCSEKDDHAGAVSSAVSKPRMEFYPRELQPGVEDKLWAGSILE